MGSFAELGGEDQTANSSPKEVSLMAITIESVRGYVRTKGEEVTILSGSQSGVRILRSGDVDLLDLVDKATHFVLSGTVYTREQLEMCLTGGTVI
jgi:hypothetical protein